MLTHSSHVQRPCGQGVVSTSKEVSGTRTECVYEGTGVYIRPEGVSVGFRTEDAIISLPVKKTLKGASLTKMQLLCIGDGGHFGFPLELLKLSLQD